MDNPPAFPSIEEHPSYDIPMHHFGMTLRDWFAGQALAGLLASGTWDNIGGGFEAYISTHAMNIADAMLAERSKA